MLGKLKAVVKGPTEKATPYTCEECRSEFVLPPHEPRPERCPDCGSARVKIKLNLPR